MRQATLFAAAIPNHQHRDRREMANFVGCLTINDILQPFVPMHRHRDQIARFPVGRGGDLHRRHATREHRFRLESISTELRTTLLDVFTIFADFFRFAELQRLHVARRPPVGDVNEQNGRATQRGQLTYVPKDGFVRRRMFQWHQNTLVHQATHARAVCHNSHMLSDAMTVATT